MGIKTKLTLKTLTFIFISLPTCLSLVYTRQRIRSSCNKSDSSDSQGTCLGEDLHYRKSSACSCFMGSKDLQNIWNKDTFETLKNSVNEWFNVNS